MPPVALSASCANDRFFSIILVTRRQITELACAYHAYANRCAKAICVQLDTGEPAGPSHCWQIGLRDKNQVALGDEDQGILLLAVFCTS